MKKNESNKKIKHSGINEKKAKYSLCNMKENESKKIIRHSEKNEKKAKAIAFGT